MLWILSLDSPVFSLDKRENNLLLRNCYLDTLSANMADLSAGLGLVARKQG